MRIATFPYMGDYNIIFKSMLNSLGLTVLLPNPITRRTIALGSKYSPDSVCVPFKYNMGNFIESLEQGATLLLQAGGGCRFDLYGETQELILRDLGYEFEFMNVFQGFNSMIEDLKHVSHNLSTKRAYHILTIHYFKLRLLDRVKALIREKISYEEEAGKCERIKKTFLNELDNLTKFRELKRLRKKTTKAIKNIKIKMSELKIRIGIIGEYYIAAEPSSSHYIENKLIDMGIEVTNHVTLSGVIGDAFFYAPRRRRLARKGYPYIRYPIGAHGTESVVHALRFAEKGYDGIVHLKPFGCMPEVNAMSALYEISKDKEIPIIYFSFDEQTSETGTSTRLEAFHDMLLMKASR